MIYRSNRTIPSRLRLLAFSLIFTACYAIFITTPSFAWTTQTIPFSGRLRAIFFFDDDTGYAVGDYNGTTNVVKYTTASGWTTVSAAGGTDTLKDVYFTSADDGCVAGDNGIYCTNDGGSTWPFSYSDGVSFETIAFVNSNRGFAGNTDNGWLYRTTDGGVTWAPYFDTGDGNGIVDIEFIGNSGFLVTNNGSTFFSGNGGQAWTPANPVPVGIGEEPKDASCIDANTCWVSEKNGVVAFTTDGGTNWTEVVVPGGDDIDGIYFIDANTGYAVMDNGDVWSTSDGGNNWNFEYNTGSNTDAVFVTPNGTVYVVGQDATEIVVSSLNISIVKQVWEVGGTAPLSSTVTVPTGARLVFLLYVKNTDGSPANDIAFTDTLDTALFDYIPGTIFKDNGSLADTATDLQIFNSTIPPARGGSGGSQTDASGAGDFASACTGIVSCPGTGADLVTFGASITQGNNNLNATANSTVAFRFEVMIK